MSFSDAVSLVLHITPLDCGGYCDEASASSDAVTIRAKIQLTQRGITVPIAPAATEPPSLYLLSRPCLLELETSEQRPALTSQGLCP